jgi:hypothetical protein
MKYTILILAFLLFSCGARNVNKEDIKTDSIAKTIDVVKTETKINENTNENIKVTNKTEINKENNIVTEVTEITPDDKTKPASVKLANGQVIDITNAKYRNEKTTDLSKEKKVSISEYNKVKKELKKALIQSRKDKETIVKLQKQIKQKKVNKQQYNILSFWWLYLLIIIAYIGYRYYKGNFKLPSLFKKSNQS